MTARTLPGLLFWPVCFSLACARPGPAEGPLPPREPSSPDERSPSENEARVEAEPAAPEAPEPSPSPAEAESLGAPAELAGQKRDSDWLLDGRKPDPNRALPEISMRHIGMHIGGESNSDEAKKPWLRAIEREKTRVLLCYRLVKSPLAGGTVGFDLYVGKGGGRPEVRRTRQHLGDADFDDCVRTAIGRVEFPAPARPTVLSYSLRFDVRDGANR